MSLVSLQVKDDIGVITLERPEALNAISSSVAESLREVLREVGSRPDILVAVLTGAGDSFCVGADLKERGNFEIDDWYSNRRQISGMFQALRELPQPSIAAVFGWTLGGGFELALSCDLMVAAEGTRMGLPEAGVGLLPAGGGTLLLARMVGIRRAKEIVYTRRRLEASEGLEMGLVTRSAPAAELQATALELAAEVCGSSPVVVREAKRLIEASWSEPLPRALELENEAWARVIVTEDRAEGIAAFNDKRSPRWRNR
ncbi:enoyl-CoA hydratase-related protein [soil metagenome]|jgi:enoyl-CoA hydratase/carnithine racemase|nr:enoyl-CoA hydratase/isomerase family protein [Actinomycetota bacterium]MDQ3217702.1 enoyl-CoA hydratase-related protein [Actinomycetota bacterium]